jgi:hypothetical protein
MPYEASINIFNSQLIFEVWLAIILMIKVKEEGYIK